MAQQYVFGYGSLAGGLATRPNPKHATGRFVAELAGLQRWWGVAMDNRISVPGYKTYRDTAGEAPAVHVAFLDLRPALAGAPAVNGVCLAVTGAELVALDRRERNYDRVDVTDALVGPVRDDARVDSAGDA